MVHTQELRDSQNKDIQEFVDRYKDVLTSEPGLTHLAEFGMDTGDTQPIFQRAYNIPVAFKESINKKIDWLLQKQCIRPSISPWSSSMVTVRKQDGTARLYVDLKRINTVTRQEPFFMPRVEEVIEGVGKVSFISKLDLTKGYYQIKMKETDVSKTAFICHRGKFEFL